MKEKYGKKRDEQLDILKGIGIILVVFAHVCSGYASTLVFLFHMPLFFFLSGAAMSYSKSKRYDIRKKIRRIIIPYIVFSILSFSYWAFFESKFRPVHNEHLFVGIFGRMDIKLQQLLNIFFACSFNDAFLPNVVLWFLPCLFVSMVLYISIQKKLGRYSLIGVSFFALIGFLLADKHMPWCIEIALVAVPFLYGGEMLYKSIKCNSIFWGVASLIISVIMIYIYNPRVDMRIHQYGEWCIFYSIALTLIFATINFSQYVVGRNFYAAQWLGRNSLAIMCMHEPIKRIMLVVLSKCSGLEVSTIRESIIMSIVITVSVVAILIPIIMAINKYIPYIVGIDNYKK